MKLPFYHTDKGSFVFATEGGCRSSQTCIANLHQCVSTSKIETKLNHNN